MRASSGGHYHLGASYRQGPATGTLTRVLVLSPIDLTMQNLGHVQRLGPFGHWGFFAFRCAFGRTTAVRRLAKLAGCHENPLFPGR